MRAFLYGSIMLPLPLGVLLIGLLLPETVAGATNTYIPLVGVPGISGAPQGLPQYLNAIYKALIGIGSLIAVVKIIIAGVKWSLSDIVTDKSEAKHDIQGALLGLIILLIPAIVLMEINPKLTSFNILGSAPQIDLTVAPTPYKAPSEKTPNEKRKECEDAGGMYNLSTGVCTPDPTKPIVIPEDIRILHSELAEYSQAQLNSLASRCPPGTKMDIAPDPTDDKWDIVSCKKI